MTAAWDDATAAPTLAALRDVIYQPTADRVEAARSALTTAGTWPLFGRLPWEIAELVRDATRAVEAYDANARRGA